MLQLESLINQTEQELYDFLEQNTDEVEKVHNDLVSLLSKSTLSLNHLSVYLRAQDVRVLGKVTIRDVIDNLHNSIDFGEEAENNYYNKVACHSSTAKSKQTDSINGQYYGAEVLNRKIVALLQSTNESMSIKEILEKLGARVSKPGQSIHTENNEKYKFFKYLQDNGIIKKIGSRRHATYQLV